MVIPDSGVSPSENVHSNCLSCLPLHSSSRHESPETQNISCTLYNYPLLRITAPIQPLDNPARNTWRHRIRPPGICNEMPCVWIIVKIIKPIPQVQSAYMYVYGHVKGIINIWTINYSATRKRVFLLVFFR